MNHLSIGVAAGALGFSLSVAAQSILYGMPPIDVTRTTAGARDDSLVTVGAQINARDAADVNQIVFGIATEAWSEPGSRSRLVGIEASNINREPSNDMRKIGMWATFKNRPDYLYWSPPADPMNFNSQAFRIESEPGTGWSRGIVFAKESLMASRDQLRPVAIDYGEVPLAEFKTWALVRYPDGWCEYYAGAGRRETRRCT